MVEILVMAEVNEVERVVVGHLVKVAAMKVAHPLRPRPHSRYPRNLPPTHQAQPFSPP